MAKPTNAQLTTELLRANARIAELEAQLVDRRVDDKSSVFRNKQVRPLTAEVMRAHEQYVATLAAARSLAMKTGRCVRVG